jgi:hypothetical protein
VTFPHERLSLTGGLELPWSLLFSKGSLVCCCRRADQDLEQIAHRSLLDEGMTQGNLRHDLVTVPPALSLAQHVTLFDQLGQDPVGGALGDPDRSGDVAQADPWVVSDANKHVRVVCQKVPASGHRCR